MVVCFALEVVLEGFRGFGPSKPECCGGSWRAEMIHEMIIVITAVEGLVRFGGLDP